VAEMMKWRNVSGGTKEYYKRRADIGNKKSEPNQNDVAYFAVDKALELLKGIVHDSRELAPMTFLRLFGYLFFDWSVVPDVLVNSSSINMVWEDDEERPLTDLSPVPKMKLFSEPGAHEYNEAAFEAFVVTRSDLVINVSHDLPVREPGSTAKHARVVENKRLDLPVNLMRVVLRFLYVYCVPKKMASENIVLSGHENSALVVFNIARAIRRLFLSRYSPSIRLPSVEAMTSAEVNEAEQRVLDMQNNFIRQVTPSESQISRILSSVIGIVSSKAFEDLNNIRKKTQSADKNTSDMTNMGADAPVVGGAPQVLDCDGPNDVDVNINNKLSKLAW